MKFDNTTSKEFDSNPLYKEKYIKSKKKSNYGKINTNFHNNKIPKECSECVCLSIILLNSVYKKDRNYCSQVFLEECKYVIKEKKKSIKKFITDNIDIASDDSNKENSDKENSDEKNLNIGILFEKIQVFS